MQGVMQTEDRMFLGTVVRVHVPEAPRDDGISLIEHKIPFGFSPPVHVHHDEDEIFYLLSGEIRFNVAGKDVVAKAGQTVVAPSGLPHGFIVTSPEGAHCLTLTNRGNFEAMMRECSQPRVDNEPPFLAGPPTPEQVEKLAAICHANRIDLLGPPLA